VDEPAAGVGGIGGIDAGRGRVGVGGFREERT
jgi:hypothetical protein